MVLHSNTRDVTVHIRCYHADSMVQKAIYGLQDYLGETLGLSIKIEPWIGRSSLPLFLRDRYEFYEVTILERPFLALVEINPEENTPGAIRKHFEQVRKNWNIDSIYITPSMPAYNRKRLITHKIPFIVPGNQMYLPDLGVDLREHIARTRLSRSSAKLSPSTQTVVLFALLCGTDLVFTPSTLADKLPYSQMTMSRAFDELEMLGLGKIETEGRERVLHFEGGKRQLWESSKGTLSSPVRKRFHIRSAGQHVVGVRSGLTALSHYSMLAEPANPEYALSPKEWKGWRGSEKVETFLVPDLDSSHITIEVWNYDPKIFAEAGTVDRFSLYLSLTYQKDERVEAALKEMIENIEW